MTEMRSAPLRSGNPAVIGGPDGVLSDAQVRDFIAGQLGPIRLDGRSVCVLVPDATRSCPMPLLLSAVHAALHGRVTQLTVLVALGTHAQMDEAALAVHLGYRAGASAERYPDMTIITHAWWDPATFVDVGTLTAERIGQLSGGLLDHTTPRTGQSRSRRPRRHHHPEPGISA